MRLPNAVYADGISKGKQTKFAGLNHNLGASDGDLWAMENMTSDYYPLLATRQKRLKYKTLTKPNGLFVWEKLCWVDGTSFYYDGERKGAVEDSVKTFAAINGYIIIMPDKKYYDIYHETFGDLEETVSATAGQVQYGHTHVDLQTGETITEYTVVDTKITYSDGTIFGEPATANTLYCSEIRWADHFRVGDAITISGSSITANNQTLIIREIDGNNLRFYENSFTNGEEPSGQAVTFQRQVPELKFMCENENRLWGCTDTTIFASKLGDPFNFYVYDGLDTDSFAVDTGSAGNFTGCLSYLGYPTFFKEKNIYKVYGSIPSNFEVMGSASLGLATGSGQSPAIAGETLFYLSRTGVCMYTGGIPSPISKAFGLERYKNGVAGSDGLKYYISMQDQSGGWHLFVYDTQRGMWHEEDSTHAIAFAYSEGNLYFLDDQGGMWITGTPQDPPETETEEDFEWFAEFADYTDDSTNKKGVSKIQIRMELEEGARCTAKLRFDSVGEWIVPNQGVIEYAADETDVKRSYYLAIIPHRADHYRLRLEGTGGCRIYSIAVEYYEGSELKSRSGRQ